MFGCFADIIKTLGSAGGELACFSTGAQGTQPTRHRALTQQLDILLFFKKILAFSVLYMSYIRPDFST